MRKLLCAFILVIVLSGTLPGPAASQQSHELGHIRGLVIDERTGDFLPFANVMVVGTTKGAAANGRGEFLVREIPVGTYSVKATMMGYHEAAVDGVEVTRDATAKVTLKLSPKVLEMKGVEVFADKPLIIPEATSSTHFVSSDEIAATPVESIEELLELQSGVTREDYAVHIRGGRSEENLYLVDGVSIKDPLSGTAYSVNLSPNVVQEMEVLTGGFNAEYGQAQSGVIAVETKEGGDEYHGRIMYKSDHFGMGDVQQMIDNFDFSLGGPEPLTEFILPAITGINVPGKLTFFMNMYVFLSDTYLPSASQLTSSTYYDTDLGPRQENDWSGFGKLTWKLSTTKKISCTFSKSLKINQDYFSEGGSFPQRYTQILDNAETNTQEGNQFSLTWKQSVSPKLIYRLDLSRVFIHLRSDSRGANWDEYGQPVNSVGPGSPSWGDTTEPSSNADTLYTPYGFYEYGDAESWHDHYSETWTLAGDLESHNWEYHKIKAGFTASYQTMQMVDIQYPWVDQGTKLGYNQDIYRVYPNLGAFFVQDNITYKGMVVNVGLRGDYWFPGELVERVIEQTDLITVSEETRDRFYEDTFELFGHRGKGRLSPRLGVAYPVTDRDKFYFSYGYFTQLPKYERVYAKLDSRSSETYQFMGNPNLNPQTTVAYEFGVQHMFNEEWMIGLTAFYKDLYDYPTARRITVETELGLASFWRYFNLDYARSRGLEFQLKRRARRGLSGAFNFTYSRATGKSSREAEELDVGQGEAGESSLREYPLDWDRPINMQLSLSYYVPDDHHPNLFGLRLPDDWSFNLLWTLKSGVRYTPREYVSRAVGEENSELGPHVSWVNAKFTKRLSLSGLDFSFFVEGRNIFNRRNVRWVNPYTGDAWKLDDPDPDGTVPTTEEERQERAERSLNPSRYYEPRNIRAGMSFNW